MYTIWNKLNSPYKVFDFTAIYLDTENDLDSFFINIFKTIIKKFDINNYLFEPKLINDIDTRVINILKDRAFDFISTVLRLKIKIMIIDSSEGILKVSEKLYPENTMDIQRPNIKEIIKHKLFSYELELNILKFKDNYAMIYLMNNEGTHFKGFKSINKEADSSKNLIKAFDEKLFVVIKEFYTIVL